MTEGPKFDELRERLTAKGEEALGRFAQELLENPLVNGAFAAAMEARDRASQAQDAAMGALNLPSASDIERLTRRVRSVSQRLEGIEDVLDRVEQSLGGVEAASADEQRLAAIEQRLGELSSKITALAAKPAPAKRAPRKPPAAKPEA